MTRYGSGYFGAGLPDEQPIPDRQMTQPTNSLRGIKEKIMSKLTDEAVYCEYDRDINHKFMACEKCQHNMKIEATKAQPTNSIDSELERLLKAFAQSMQINEQLYHSGDNSLKTRDIDNEVSINNALQAIKALYVRKEDCKCVKSTAGTVRQNT